jgi:LAS superfamily LD-carboxypeptidase LdcB
MSEHKTETHAIRAGDNRTLTAKAPSLPEGAFTSASLAPMKTPEATHFMRRVYDAQVRNSLAAKKTYFSGLPDDDLRLVEGDHWMHKEASDDCRWLLLFARQDLERMQATNPRKQPITIGVASAYRTPAEDGKAWHSAFTTHYDDTKSVRDGFATGPHGEEAFRLLLKIMPKAKAAAGFSNHTQGRAVDFCTQEVIDGKSQFLTAKTSQHELWKKSWFFKWLVADGNAAKYRFVELSNKQTTEEWHYDHRIDMKLPGGKQIPENAQGEDGELLASRGGDPSDSESET